MDAALFYETHASGALPVELVNKVQWEALRATLPQSVQNHLKASQFEAGVGELGRIPDENGMTVRYLLGTGDQDDIALAMAYMASRLPPESVVQVTTALGQREQIIWALAQYRFDAYKAQTAKPRKLVVDADMLPEVLREVQAIFLVRDLINRPTNACGPSELSDVLKELAATHGGLFEEWVGEALLDANFPAIHAVGRAAADAPRLLSLTWGEVHHPRVVLVGKGVCFDSGGLDIKPSSAMRLMKKDMGGAAHAMGLAAWIMASRLPVRLHVLVPAVENAISANAYRPGDVIRMRNGLTVEIDNTDAEGRLVLADALSFGCEQEAALIVDFATLTGAARVAVGTEIAAFFCNDEMLAADLSRASADAEDPLWRLPLFAPYKSLLDSSIADMVNSGASPYAGAITAALFMERFVKKRTPWVHFDVMAWNVTNKPGKPEGGEAMGIRAVAQYLKQRFNGQDQCPL
ncbi:aminopeptidase [Legionella geestiana]|uniref:Aminopeptidase n=1 Tax=Legionella geestiana TaxID=45065 RepID=A0A0W0TX04_9GAMM|nr:leucyl aminopeptidase family protein [Legionella geestiana]KTD00176.1 aminopeptidase [Legionella geestiana]QBS11781.1 leucyl aminopeptidase family protein [Legionella geestiana]STX53527.1 aminopeptidase [Legionella geestiana]